MKKTIFVLIALLALTSLFAVSAAAYPTVEGTPLLLDDAGLLSETEFAQVESDLKTYSDMHGIDIAVVTVNSLEEFGYTGYDAAMNFADDYFDYNGFGRGADRSGLVLVLAMQTRDWWISTRGSAIRTFTDYGINTYIGEKGIVPMFHSGQYAAAFREYAARADALIRYEKENGEPYDYDS
ncbi:MAG: TPM domain-containing protein, partial [Clostridia bacterium]|nr:TPM domain-containing protein [Clostridia bacterium]